MKFSAAHSDLLNAADFVGYALGGTKSPLPILSHILFDANNDGLTLCATNTELTARCRVTTNPPALRPWTIAVPGKTLIDWLNVATGNTIELSGTERSLVVKSGGATTTLKGLPAEDFPEISFASGHSCRVPAVALKRMLRVVSHAVSKDSTTGILTGILFEIRPQSMSVVATDRVRLSISNLTIEGNGQEATFVIPANNCRAIAKMIDDNGDVQIAIGGNGVTFSMSQRDITATLLLGEYPNYTPVVPKDFSVTARVLSRNFLIACQQALLFTKDIGNIVRLIVKRDQIVVRAEGGGAGDGGFLVPIENQGESVVVDINGGFLKEILQVVGEQVTFKISQGKQAVIIEDGEDVHVIALIRSSPLPQLEYGATDAGS